MLTKENNEFIPELYLDTFFDYKNFITKPIGTMPSEHRGQKVAIIGAGAAGLLAARLLLEVGLEPVIFEASDRIGGRLYSQYFNDKDGPSNAFAELGAMRIPLSSQVFFHLADQFEMDTDIEFPDPGLVDTLLSFQNNKHYWKANTPVPEPFSAIKKNWELFITPLIEKITTPWRQGDIKKTQEIWQNYIDHYKGTSFYDAIRSGSPVWTEDELKKFGTLGIGTGGFGPLYHIGFIEILRVILHKWEVNQKLIKDGVETFAMKLVESPVNTPSGSEAVGKGRILLNHKVNEIYLNDNNQPTLSIYKNGEVQSQSFSSVIVATTTRNMQFMGLSQNTSEQGALLASDVQTAIRKTHLINSSKLFIRTKDKFWKNYPGKMPLTVLTDEIPSSTYLLDYPQTENGVICVSYTWGDDSCKVAGLEPMERFGLFRDSLKKIVPELAENLIPLENEIIHIDWQMAQNYHGAFKLNLPGHEDDTSKLYYQYKSVLDPQKNTGIYLAGDSVSWSGGWIEGALHTAINAACSAVKNCNGKIAENSPLDIPADRYKYL